MATNPIPPPHITIGVCGGIAAYRAVELVRLLQQSGFDPHVVMTAAAEQFVTPLTFAAISGHKVIRSLWTEGEVPEADGTEADGTEAKSSIEHIALAQTTRALIIVPATASIIGKLAHGIADDFLTTLYLATPAPVLIAPAMNVVMLNHPSVQANLSLLKSRGNHIVEPGSGYLACGMTGSGRLADLHEILAALHTALATSTPQTRDLELETVLITAGGTREPIDGVRFLGNRSSGRMGYALAAEAAARGARVLLISTVNNLPVPANVELIPVTTAAEMRTAVLDALPRATLILKAAAVADFRAANPTTGKLHRTGSTPLTLALEPTEDIVAEAAANRSPGTLIIAFAAEIPEPGTNPDNQALLKTAREKMLRKSVDAIVLNDVSLPGLGFDSDSNAATILFADPTTPARELPPMPKRDMARHLLDEVVTLRSLSHVPAKA